MKKKYFLPLILLVAVITVIVLVSVRSAGTTTDAEILVNSKKGEFVVDVTTSGSLEAKNSVKINGPNGLRNYRIWNVTIQDIIDEGTFVKKGQYVARLDPSELTGKINDAQLEVDKQQSQFTQTRLDTALTMRQARDELVNLDYAMKERQLTLDQSQFEPPATIQKAEIDLEKSKRAYQQAKENYEIKKEQNIAKMQEVAASLRKATNELIGLQELSAQFTVLAPEDGMLIYQKSWDGNPIKAGSQIGAWDPVVATLPDLSVMLSKTYVNEVDIRKIKPGQLAEIGFDAFPELKVMGRVIRVANVGEQRPNSDAKVFQVDIEIAESNPLLKPGMTTSNQIITNKLADVVYVPLESIHSRFDSITFVYKKEGINITKQEVILGESNSDNVVILSGLSVGDRVFLSNISTLEDQAFSLLEEMNGKRQKKKQEEPEYKPDSTKINDIGNVISQPMPRRQRPR